MSTAIDRIIGYENAKDTLHRICDIIRNPQIYQKLGAKTPKGLMLHGVPGVGKTMMAKALMEDLGIPAFTIRRVDTSEAFIREIKDTFAAAAEQAPSVILLDDMDKFPANEKSAEEFTAVQACMDEVSDKPVFVVATANDIDDIPDSLLRSGRLERKIEIERPHGKTAKRIIRRYLEDKPVEDDINMDDIAKMMCGCSCAALETILNEAAMMAAFERHHKITMDHFLKAFLCHEYCEDGYDCGEDGYDTGFETELDEICVHEAGHAVMLELLSPGSVGMMAIVSPNRCFVRRACHLRSREHRVMVHLAGLAASELVFGIKANGAASDLDRALDVIRNEVISYGKAGSRCMEPFGRNTSPTIRATQELTIQHELDRYIVQAKTLLAKNRTVLERVAAELKAQKVLLNSDVTRLCKDLCRA